MAEERMAETSAPLGERLLAEVAADARLRSSRGAWRHPWKLLEPSTPFQILLLAALSGLAGAGVLITLTAELKNQVFSVTAGAVFVLLIVLYRWLQLALFKSTTVAIEAALNNIRVRIAEKLTRLSLSDFERQAREEVQAKMTRHYEVISEAVMGLLSGLQSAVLLAVTLVYLATLSITATLLSCVVLGIAVYAYFASQEEIQQGMRSSTQAETAILGALGEIVDGFKELRLDAAKRAALLEELRINSARSARERTIIQGLHVDLFVFGNSLAFLLGGAVVFVVPLLLDNPDVGKLAPVVTVILFIIGPLSAVIAAAQRLSVTRFAVNSLREFEGKLDAVLPPEPPPAILPPFESLRIAGALHAYHDASDGSFTCGPIDLEVRQGEIVFLTGGNGSGKSTAMRVITGLYPSDAGRIYLNGKVLSQDPGVTEAYRRYFGAVFADPHVFRRPYALNEERIAVLRDLLARFGMSDKLPRNLEDGYDPGALSTGQRKRLALALALAEDRPVLAFDELAADQEPTFRHYFYETLLPELKSAGKAVIAITHDDRYFDVADRRYHMEEGHMALVVER